MCDIFNSVKPHIDDYRAPKLRNGAPANPVIAASAACDKGHGLSDLPMRYRNIQGGGHRKARGYAAHYLDFDSSSLQRHQFFTASSKDAGIAPFQPSHNFASFRMLDKE